MKHTPGPWEVGYCSLNVMARDEKGSFPVCDIRGWGHLTGRGHGALGLSPDEAEAIQTANARLIAAAPDLLDALQNAEQVIAESQGEPIPEEWADLLDEIRATLLNDIRAAIAKATGEPRK